MGSCILVIYGFGKPYDTIDQNGTPQILRMYEVGGKLLKAVQSFYVDSRTGYTGGKLGMGVNEWIPD